MLRLRDIFSSRFLCSVIVLALSGCTQAQDEPPKYGGLIQEKAQTAPTQYQENTSRTAMMNPTIGQPVKRAEQGSPTVTQAQPIPPKIVKIAVVDGRAQTDAPVSAPAIAMVVQLQHPTLELFDRALGTQVNSIQAEKVKLPFSVVSVDPGSQRLLVNGSFGQGWISRLDVVLDRDLANRKPIHKEQATPKTTADGEPVRSIVK